MRTPSSESGRLPVYWQEPAHYRSFNGSSAQVFGTVNAGYGQYAVRWGVSSSGYTKLITSLDGENQGTYNASWFQPGFNVSRS